MITDRKWKERNIEKGKGRNEERERERGIERQDRVSSIERYFERTF